MSFSVEQIILDINTHIIGKALKDTNLKIDKNNFNQYSEIKNVKWFT